MHEDTSLQEYTVGHGLIDVACDHRGLRHSLDLLYHHCYEQQMMTRRLSAKGQRQCKEF